MSAALRLYEQLTEATDDKTRARLIAEAFEELEARFDQHAIPTPRGNLFESALRLREEIKSMQARLIHVIHRQTLLRIGALGAILGLNRMLDELFRW